MQHLNERVTADQLSKAVAERVPQSAHQLWGSTKAAYDDLHRLQFDDDGRMMRVERAEMVRETAFAESDHIASFEPRTPA